MAGTQKSRESWIEAALDALAEDGLAGVRVEVLARVLGVTKGSFYWHFTNRRALLEAMLGHWEQTQTLEVIQTVEAGGGDALDRLKGLSQLTEKLFNPHLDMALRDWARRDGAAAAVVRRVDERRIDYLRQLLRGAGFDAINAEARAMLLYASLMGHALIDVDHGKLSRDAVRAASFHLLTRAGEPRPPAL